ncbi:MAG: hypothetical protein A4E35_02258 [Methanoregula sp. PtaU1.Bin051]|nr:MAG: hypothetical protein A4E35_02258 [Methanoregula sp. PtaU1.Bin051]
MGHNPKKKRYKNTSNGFNSRPFLDTNKGKILLIVISAIVGYLIFWAQIQLTNAYQQRDIANNFLAEIDVIEHPIKATADRYNLTEIFNMTPQFKDDPIYQSTGLFFRQSNDIGKLNQDLATDLHLFYYRLTVAEADRVRVNQFLGSVEKLRSQK